MDLSLLTDWRLLIGLVVAAIGAVFYFGRWSGKVNAVLEYLIAGELAIVFRRGKMPFWSGVYSCKHNQTSVQQVIATCSCIYATYICLYESVYYPIVPSKCPPPNKHPPPSFDSFVFFFLFFFEVLHVTAHHAKFLHSESKLCQLSSRTELRSF